MTPEEIEKVIDDFGKKFPDLVKEMEKYDDTLKLLIKSQTDLKVTGVDLDKNLKKLCESVIRARKAFDEIKKGLGDVGSSMQDHSKQIDSLGKSYDTQNRTVKQTTDQTKRAAADSEAAIRREIDERLKATKSFTESMGEISGTVLAGLGKAIISTTTQAMRSGNAFEMATAAMNAGVDIAAKGASAGAKGMQDLGSSMASMGGKGRIAGLALSAVGGAAGAATGALSELAKAGIAFMMSETQKMITGFQTMSSVGAVYAGGMQEMTKTANSAGMTLEQFSKATAANKESFAKAGLGVAEGSRRMSRAMNEGGEKARVGMMALGMGMEEQAEAYATVMGQMAGSSGKLNASNKEIADRTEEYASNLKLLSNLTGEDMKAKKAKIDEETNNLAFQQRLNRMGETERSKLMESMKGMSEVQRKALQERMVYGTVISKDIAVAEANNSGLRKLNEETFNAAKAGKMSVDENSRLQGKYRGEIHDQNQNAIGIAMSRNETARGASKYMLEADQNSAKFSEERVKAEKEAAEKAKADAQSKDKDKPVGGADLMAAQQDFAVGMQKIAEKNLPQFTAGLKATLETMQSAVSALAGASAKAGSVLSNVFDPANIAGLLAMAFGPAIVTGLAKKIFGGMAGAAPAAAGPRLPGTGGIVGPGQAGPANLAGKAMEGVGAGAEKLGAGAGKGATGILKGIADGIASFGNAKVFLGIVNLGLLAGAVMVASVGFKEFNTINWSSIGKGIVAIGLLAAGAALIGSPAVVGWVGLGALAIAGLGVSIGILGAALKGFPTGFLDNLSGMFSGMGKALGGMFGDVFKQVKDVFVGVWDYIKGFVSSVAAPFKKAFGTISDKVSELGAMFTRVFTTVKDIVLNVGSAIAAPFIWAFGKISEGVTWVGDNFGKIFGFIKDTAVSVGTAIAAPFNWAFDNIGAGVAWVSEKFGGLWDWIKEIGGKVSKVLLAPFTFAFDLITGKITDVGSIFKKVFSVISDLAKSAFEIVTKPITMVVDLFKGVSKIWDKITGKKPTAEGSGDSEADKKAEELAKKQEESNNDFITATRIFSTAVTKFSEIISSMKKLTISQGETARVQEQTAKRDEQTSRKEETRKEEPKKEEGKPQIPEQVKKKEEVKAGEAGKPVSSSSDMNKYLKSIALIESGGDRNAKAGTSSAGGLFQFTKGTWAETSKQMGKNYTDADKFDPKKAAEVAEFFSNKQKGQMEKGLGRGVNNTDMYMGHFLGAGGATKFLKAKDQDPSQSAAALDRKAAAANKNIYYDKAGKERSVKEVYDLMDKKVKGAEKALETGKWGKKGISEDVANITNGGKGGTEPAKVKEEATAEIKIKAEEEKKQAQIALDKKLADIKTTEMKKADLSKMTVEERAKFEKDLDSKLAKDKVAAGVEGAKETAKAQITVKGPDGKERAMGEGITLEKMQQNMDQANPQMRGPEGQTAAQRGSGFSGLGVNVGPPTSRMPINFDGMVKPAADAGAMAQQAQQQLQAAQMKASSVISSGGAGAIGGGNSELLAAVNKMVSHSERAVELHSAQVEHASQMSSALEDSKRYARDTLRAVR